MGERLKNILSSCFIIVIILTADLFSASTRGVTLQETGDNGTVLRYTLPSYSFKEISVKGEKYHFIYIPDAAYETDAGYPDLPHISQSIVIPSNAQMTVEIVEVCFQDVAIDHIVPSRGMIYRNQAIAQIPYVFGAVYNENVWIPSNVVTLSKPFILRDVRGITVYFHPVQYNPVQKKVRIAESITVRIKQRGFSKENVLIAESNQVSPVYNDIYSRRFANYSSLRYPSVADGDRMVILYASHYNRNSIQPLVEWKNMKGIATTVYAYPEATGSGAYAVKNFLNQHYRDSNITYILLIGDHRDIPSLVVDGGVSDPSYVLLAGTDIYPDAFIGRFSVESDAELEVLVNKVLKYEKEPDNTGDWYQKAVGIASNEGVPTDREWMDEFRGVMLGYGFSSVDQLYDPGAVSTSVTTSINDGRGWVNYMGHGGATSWVTTGFSNTHVNALNNGDKLPVVISVACVNGDFSSSTCFAEAWTRKKGGGALLFLGSTINQVWTPPQYAQKEMVNLLCADTYISAGAIIYNGECAMLEKTNSNDGNTFKTWTLFGDPSVMVYTKKPTSLTVTCPASIGSGTQNLQISFGETIDGRVCVYSNENGILATKIVSQTTTATIPITITTEKVVRLTVTARNKAAVIKDIMIDNAPYIYVTAPVQSHTFYPGKQMTIQWCTGGGVSGVVAIEISTDNAAPFTTIAALTDNDGSYQWTIPDTFGESDRCIIRVASVSDTVKGVSKPFAIKYKPVFTLNTQQIQQTIQSGSAKEIELAASNSGAGQLVVTASSKNTSRRVNSGSCWITVTPTKDTVMGLESTKLKVTLDAAGLETGSYADTLMLFHNDPDQESPLLVTVNLEVTSTGIGTAALSSGMQQIKMKRSAETLLLYLPVQGVYDASVVDLKGRVLTAFKTDNPTCWYRLPLPIASGIRVLCIKTSDKVYVLKLPLFH